MAPNMKKVAFQPNWSSAARKVGVETGSGPSSKVRAT